MTKKLESLFDLPTEDDEKPTVEIQEDEIVDETPAPQEITEKAMNNFEKIDNALPAIKGLEASDTEMDEIAEMALEDYKELFNLGMNVEARIANEILGSATTLLGHAITARNAKINKKLKMIELQLKKAKLDQDRGDDPAETETGTGEIVDRNELLKQILSENKANEDNKKE